MKTIQSAVSLLICAMLVSGSIVSCSKDTPTESNISTDFADTNADTAAETTADPYAGIDLSGMDLRLLNVEGRQWGLMSIIEYPEQTGVSLDDAIYDRNRTLEEKLNMKMVVSEKPTDDCKGALDASVLAGDDLYDGVFTLSDDLAAHVIAGNYLNLLDIPTLHMDEPWWEPGFNGILTLGNGYLYGVSTPFQLITADMTVACFMNTKILTDNGITLPYDAVREDTWTYDAMYAAMSPCVSLNGDTEFDPKQPNATYGVATFEHWIGVMATTAGEIVQKDENGLPYWAGATEHMIDTYTAMAKLFSGDGYMVKDVPGQKDYYEFFSEGRAAFLLVSAGFANMFRDMDAPYGILPIPKYLETDSYSSPIGSTLLFGIPSTCRNAENVGIALDALSRWSYENILPVYYESLCYKGLRDEDSIEMLDIITDTRTTDLGRTYGWTLSFLAGLGTSIAKDSQSYASKFAAVEGKISGEIAKTVADMEGQWK